MSTHPADRTAKRASSAIEPGLTRQRIAEIFAALEPTQHFVAVDIVSAWPRLIHQLAREGALAIPALNPRI
ncbi:MAG: hypothetical protein ABUS57_00845 [Pseudomonadota bacterium]